MKRTQGENQELPTHRGSTCRWCGTSCSRWRCTSPATSTVRSWPRAGALGLVEAARRYDESRGVPFDRFAAQRIRGAILDAVRAADWAPRSVRNLARKLESIEQRLATELGRVPTADETAEALGMTHDELRRLQDRMFRSVVLALEYEVNDADEDLTLVDVLSRRQHARAARGARDPRAARLPA